MKIKLVDLARQNKNLKSQLLKTIDEVITRGEFIMGKGLKKFEEEFALYCNKKYAVGLNSGTDALKLALLAYGVGPGDEVITAANGYFSDAMVISEIGAIPVFVDIDEITYTIDVKKIKEKITPKTKAIIPVHMYGQAADMDPILSIAKKHDLVVIEDACQAHGALYKDNIVPYGETGAFSFYPGKNLGCFGDGGILVTDNPEVAEKVRYLSNDGSKVKYHHKMIGIKSRLDTIQAAILSLKLPMLDEWNEQRRKNALIYNNLLKKIDSISTPVELDYAKHVYHLYVIESEHRDQLRRFLTSHDIDTGVHYPVPIHLQEAYANKGFKAGDFPITEKKASRILSLPMFPELTEQEILSACKVIKEFKPA